MAGTINSLGIGSGVLTSDVIDKLKSNDTSLIISPIANKITLQQQKSSALNLLSSLLTTFKSSASALNDDALYQQRSVSGTNSGVNVTAAAGVSIQSFSISNVQMAMKNVQESGTFLSTDAKVASGSGTMTIHVGGLSYDVGYTSTTSLSDLKESINSIAGAKVKASTLQVGTNDYRLVLTSVETGASETISISDSAGGSLDTALLGYDAATNPNGMQEIQAARDASFKYNGITLTRSTNEISDVITGVTINLLEDNASANISISQDVSAISSEMQSFADNYNSLVSQLTSMTIANLDEGKVGIFNGDSSINSIKREINKIITSMDSNGLSLAQFGIDLKEDGTMVFTSSTFKSKFNEDPALSEKFMSGYLQTDVNGNDTEVEGVFTSLNNLLDRYTKSGGIISNLTDNSTTELKALNENKTRSQALIDARYEAMTARFIQYDAIISRLNSQFSTLSQQIQMAVNAKN